MGALLSNRTKTIAILIFCAIFTLPIVLSPCPALVDFPEHLQRCLFLRQWLSGGPASPFYQPDFHFLPNLAMELTVILLSLLVGIDWAGKLFALAVAALPCLGASLVQRQLSGRWSLWSLVPAALLYNHVFEFGFVNYLAAIGLALTGIAVHLKLAGAPLRKRLVWALLFAAATLTAHLGGFIVYAVSILLVDLASVERGARKKGAALASLAPGLVALALGALIMLTIGRSTASSRIAYFSVGDKLGYLLHPLSDSTTAVGTGMQLLLDLAIIAMAWFRAVRLDTRLLPAILFWGSTVFWFPYLYGNSGVFVDMRMAIVFTLFLFAGSTPTFRAPTHRTLTIAMLAICALLGWGQHLYKDLRANEVYSEATKDFSSLPSRSAVFILTPYTTSPTSEAGWYPPMLHVPALAMRQDLFLSNFFGDKEEQPVVTRSPYDRFHYQRLSAFVSESQWLATDGRLLCSNIAALPREERPSHVYLYMTGPNWDRDSGYMRVTYGRESYSIYEVAPALWNR